MNKTVMSSELSTPDAVVLMAYNMMLSGTINYKLDAVIVNVCSHVITAVTLILQTMLLMTQPIRDIPCYLPKSHHSYSVKYGLTPETSSVL